MAKQLNAPLNRTPSKPASRRSEGSRVTNEELRGWLSATISDFEVQSIGGKDAFRVTEKKNLSGQDPVYLDTLAACVELTLQKQALTPETIINKLHLRKGQKGSVVPTLESLKETGFITEAEGVVEISSYLRTAIAAKILQKRIVTVSFYNQMLARLGITEASVG